jgi:hypothetical protein
MSGAADLVELARRVSAVSDRTALLDGRELTPATPLPTYAENASGGPVTAAAVHPQSPDGVGTPEISWLATQLYGHCYVRPVPRSRSTTDAAAVHAFRLGLSAANMGRGHWETGWDLGEGAAAQAVRRSVRRYGVEFVTTPERVRFGGPTTSVLVPKERRELHPGYYVALGDAPWLTPGSPLVRVYWNLSARGASVWMEAVTRDLNRDGVPFMAKLRDHPDGHGRADSAVLYLPGGVDRPTHERLAGIYAAVSEYLVGDEPMFTRMLAPGVGVATDPGDGLSFGQHRCELVAHGLRAHRESGRPDVAEERYDAIARAFREAGVDPEQPHRGVDETGYLDSLAFGTPRESVVPAGSREVDLLAAAAELGDLLCETAYWNKREGRCTWIGRRPDVTSYAHGRTPQPIAVSLDARLYDGNAGTALFLGELSELTGDERHRRTALGAIATAGRQVQSLITSGDLAGGFYTGVCGLA